MAKGLKDINRFMRFDLDGWKLGKTFTYVGAEVWNDDKREPCGVKHHIMVTKDETEYPYDGVTNLGAQLTIKERGATVEQVRFVPFETVVDVVDVEKATAWRAGEYSSQDLSIIGKVRAVRDASKGGE